ncbi:hypothetical protein D4764_01G0004870 [Takifugu flavidus]|uniref:Uncharacterized protein n=1 Tax=Takifugu flavidus TaxID=433684 RepID=A0A5C6PLH8_9TELE|nr:hypothetical protein D4764_01G0004870 [Takifugu flavidus]
MRISTSKSEAMVLDRKKVECLLRVKEEILPQVEEFKYLGVLFTSGGRMEREIDRRIGAASTVMRTLHRSVVVKRELSRKAKLSIYRVAGLSLRDRVRSSDIREGLGVEPLLLHIERSQLGWLGHLARMPSGRLPLEVFRTCPPGGGLVAGPGLGGEITSLAWLGSGWGSPGRADGSGRGKGCLSIPPEAAAPATRIRISGKKQNKILSHQALS